MENGIIRQRLASLRDWMGSRRVDFCLIPSGDYHQSEYVHDHFRFREYMSGFSGSAGTLLVWREGAGLWTDGRYFVQAEKELAGTGIELFRMQDAGVPTLEAFLEKSIQPGQSLGFNGRLLSLDRGRRLEERLAALGARVDAGCDMESRLWADRPRLPAAPLRVLEDILTGQTAASKLEELRRRMEEEGAQALFCSKLDEIMWLCNIRGGDVPNNPVAFAYALLTRDQAYVYLQEASLDEDTRAHLAGQGISLRPYAEMENPDFSAYLEGNTVWSCPKSTSYAHGLALEESGRILALPSPIEALKACKNPVEWENMRRVYIQDSLALTLFIRDLKGRISAGQQLDEVEAAALLEEYRRRIPAYREPSFDTISAYGANAAMMHYDPKPGHCALLEARGFYLVDSGGQYDGGTTDVTRTIALGELTGEQKAHYTWAAAGMLALQNARFLYGCTGRNLDILARQPLWARGIDYKCGTGHGLGYMLNVHEGPQRIAWRGQPEGGDAVLEEGMVLSNEPGVYMDGEYGIRVENMMVVRGGESNAYGRFMDFDVLTYVPLELEAIDAELLDSGQIRWINDYHRQVWETLSPWMEEDARLWLREATRAIG